jgi:hypothetical protein
VRQKCAFLRERGFASVHLAASCGEATGVALTSNAAQVAGLGRILFWTSLAADFRGFHRLEIQQHECRTTAAIISLLIIRFLFSYNCSAFMRPEKIGLFSDFRRRYRASTSTSRLVSRSRLEADFRFR